MSLIFYVFTHLWDELSLRDNKVELLSDNISPPAGKSWQTITAAGCSSTNTCPLRPGTQAVALSWICLCVSVCVCCQVVSSVKKQLSSIRPKWDVRGQLKRRASQRPLSTGCLFVTANEENSVQQGSWHTHTRTHADNTDKQRHRHRL